MPLKCLWDNHDLSFLFDSKAEYKTFDITKLIDIN